MSCGSRGRGAWASRGNNMDRIQRALDLSKSQRLHPAAAPDEARLERTTLYREFGVAPVDFASRLPLDWKTLRDRRGGPPTEAHPPRAASPMLRHHGFA